MQTQKRNGEQTSKCVLYAQDKPDQNISRKVHTNNSTDYKYKNS